MLCTCRAPDRFKRLQVGRHVCGSVLYTVFVGEKGREKRKRKTRQKKERTGKKERESEKEKEEN